MNGRIMSFERECGSLVKNKMQRTCDFLDRCSMRDCCSWCSLSQFYSCACHWHMPRIWFDFFWACNAKGFQEALQAEHNLRSRLLSFRRTPTGISTTKQVERRAGPPGPGQPQQVSTHPGKPLHLLPLDITSGANLGKKLHLFHAHVMTHHVHALATSIGLTATIMPACALHLDVDARCHQQCSGPLRNWPLLAVDIA